jgi:hypothetical protein
VGGGLVEVDSAASAAEGSGGRSTNKAGRNVE